MNQLKVLLIGYSGANNTGAEALLQADIGDLRAVLGEDALVTIPALKDPANLRRYLRKSHNLRIVPMPSVFFSAARRLVREHDLVMLVEGSAYMDTWTSALLWYFLWATRCAHAAGKPCLAYAVDAGQLRPFNRWLVRREGSKTDLIITRSAAAAERLRSWGVTASIESTADNAFTFEPEAKDETWLSGAWPDKGLGTLRYTSGTTGRPKGVAYTHAQLRWMAETLVALMPCTSVSSHCCWCWADGHPDLSLPSS